MRLFDRNTRSATLTPAGRRMLAYAERIVRLDGEMRRDIDAASDAGLIRIGVIESIVHSWFPTLMAQLRERYPRLDVEITSDTTLHLIRLLSTDGVDLILQTDPVPGPISRTRRCEFPVRWAASPRLGPAAGARRRAPRGIPDHQLRATQPHATIERLFAAVERPASINCITSVAAMIRLVADGFGVAALPPAIIGRELHEGTLELLDVEPEFPALPLVATYRSQACRWPRASRNWPVKLRVRRPPPRITQRRPRPTAWTKHPPVPRQKPKQKQKHRQKRNARRHPPRPPRNAARAAHKKTCSPRICFLVGRARPVFETAVPDTPSRGTPR